MKNKQYDEYNEEDWGVLIGKHLKYLLQYNKIHPTKTIKFIIQEIYGHKVKLKELINLIESSDL